MNSNYEKFNNLFNHYSFTSYDLKDLTNEEIDFKLLSKHPDIHYSWIQKNLNDNWDCWELSQQVYLSIPNEFIHKNLNKNWDFKALSKNHYFNLEWLEMFPNAEWDFYEITNVLYREINLKILHKYPNENWDFKLLSQEPKSQFEFYWLEHFPNANWDFKKLTKHKKFYIEFIDRFPDAEWDFKYLSRRGKVTLEILKNFPYPKKWDFQKLSRNKNLELEWLELCPLEDWDFDAVFHFLHRLDYSAIRMIKLQHLMPHKPLLKYFKNYKIPIYDTISLVLLNPENKKYYYYNNNDIHITGIRNLSEINDVEKKNMIKVIEKGISFDSYIPQMFNKISGPLQIQDLSGDVFLLDNWFESQNIMEDFKNQNSAYNLGEFDIFINDIFLSQVTTKIQKEIILLNDMESKATLVYGARIETEETKKKQKEMNDNFNINILKRKIQINFL